MSNNNQPSASSYVFALWNLIIRPPRNRYDDSRLYGVLPKKRFTINGQMIHRKEFEATNDRGIKLVGTLFEPQVEGSERACVVHCHGNSSNRLEGFQLVPVLCPMNIAVACFDFAGCGNSGGDYISLGFHERNDLAVILEQLRSRFGFTRLGVWGYSMGAASALMHASRDMSIAGMVLDSPFADLCTLITQLASNQLHLPAMLVNTILPILRLIIQNKAEFDIYEVSPSKHVSSCYVPAFILHGERDDFIPPSHSEQVKREYTGESMRVLMPETTHTSIRNKVFYQRAAVFLVRALRWEAFLPSHITEERLAQMADTREVRAQEAPVGSGPVARIAKAMADEGIHLLLNSAQRERRCLGVIFAACDFCAYRGAELLHCKPGTRGEPYIFDRPLRGTNPRVAMCDAHCSSSLPASFAGNVVFPDDRAEIALCWVQSGSKASTTAAEFKVYFAMLSANAISLTRVTLIRDDAKAPSPTDDLEQKEETQPEKGSGVGGLHCVTVEPLTLTAAQLVPGEKQNVRLMVTLGSIVLTAGEARLDHSERGHMGQVDLWCLQWRARANCDSQNAEVRLELTAGREPELGQQPLEEVLRYVEEGEFDLAQVGFEADRNPRGLQAASVQGPRCLAATGPIPPRHHTYLDLEGTLSSPNISIDGSGLTSPNGTRLPFAGALPFEERMAQSLAKICLGDDTDSSETRAGSSDSGMMAAFQAEEALGTNSRTTNPFE